MARYFLQSGVKVYLPESNPIIGFEQISKDMCPMCSVKFVKMNISSMELDYGVRCYTCPSCGVLSQKKLGILHTIWLCIVRIPRHIREYGDECEGCKKRKKFLQKIWSYWAGGMNENEVREYEEELKEAESPNELGD